MKPLALDPGALAELKEAVEHYEAQTRGAGERLRAGVDRAMEFLRANPQLCSPVRGTRFRKRAVPRFSYIIYFREMPDFIWVAAVSHTSRRPGYWSDRTPPG